MIVANNRQVQEINSEPRPDRTTRGGFSVAYIRLSESGYCRHNNPFVKRFQMREIEKEEARQARIPCRCGHSELNHDHYPPENQHCGYPGCTCIHYRPAPTPEAVIKAGQAIAAYMKELGYEKATVHTS